MAPLKQKVTIAYNSVTITFVAFLHTMLLDILGYIYELQTLTVVHTRRRHETITDNSQHYAGNVDKAMPWAALPCLALL